MAGAFLEILGTARQAVTAAERNGAAGDPLDRAIIRITPRRIISFGIDDTDTRCMSSKRTFATSKACGTSQFPQRTATFDRPCKRRRWYP